MRDATTHLDKISPEFESRLARLGPGESLQVVVMLQAPTSNRDRSRRLVQSEKQAAARNLHDSAEEALDDIETILGRHGGRRLQSGVSALGSLTVETNAEGVRALAGSGHVKAILENQPISLVRGSHK